MQSLKATIEKYVFEDEKPSDNERIDFFLFSNTNNISYWLLQGLDSCGQIKFHKRHSVPNHLNPVITVNYQQVSWTQKDNRWQEEVIPSWSSASYKKLIKKRRSILLLRCAESVEIINFVLLNWKPFHTLLRKTGRIIFSVDTNPFKKFRW